MYNKSQIPLTHSFFTVSPKRQNLGIWNLARRFQDVLDVQQERSLKMLSRSSKIHEKHKLL